MITVMVTVTVMVMVMAMVMVMVMVMFMVVMVMVKMGACLLLCKFVIPIYLSCARRCCTFPYLMTRSKGYIVVGVKVV